MKRHGVNGLLDYIKCAAVLMLPILNLNAYEFITEGDGRLFPEEWYVGTKSKIIFFEKLDQRIPIVKECIDNEASKYTPKILANIGNFFILKELKFDGCEYGGTYFSNNILLYCDRKDIELLKEKIKETFHHEFSSVLLRNKPWAFNKSEWEKCNPSGFHYGKGGFEFLKDGDKVEYNDAFIEDGFITTYSMSGLEDDFNVLCEHVFSGKNSFYELLKRKPSAKLRRKIEIVKQFFVAMDPEFKSAEIELCLKNSLSPSS